MSKPRSVEIVRARSLGVRGYINVGRGTYWGNPHRSDGTKAGAARAVALYREHFATLEGREKRLRAYLDALWIDGVVLIACPCNGVFKGRACHATVIADALREMIAERENAHAN